MECWSVYQLGMRGHVSARRPVEKLVGEKMPVLVRLWDMWDLGKVAWVTS